MATQRQRSSYGLALQKANSSVKSNVQIDSESQVFLPNQSENRLQPNCEGLDKFAMQYFDEEAMRAYLQMLHGLIERLTEKSKNSVNPSSCEDFSVRLDENLRICEKNRKAGKAESRSVRFGKFSNSALRKNPIVHEETVESKENLLRNATRYKELNRKRCTFCNLMHDKGKENCSAYSKICHKCKQYNHFSVVCRTKKSKIKVDGELGKTTEVSLRKNSSANLRKHSKTPMVECRKENSDAEIPHEKQAGIKPEVIRSDQPISNEKVTLQWINEKLRTNYLLHLK